MNNEEVKPLDKFFYDVTASDHLPTLLTIEAILA